MRTSRWRANRQVDRERGSFAKRRFDASVTLQPVHTVGDDGQPQPGSGVPRVVVPIGTASIEKPENRTQLRFSDTDPVVAHDDPAVIWSLRRLRADLDEARRLVWIRVLDGIGNQVDEHELETSDIGRDGGKRVG